MLPIKIMACNPGNHKNLFFENAYSSLLRIRFFLKKFKRKFFAQTFDNMEGKKIY